MQEKTRFTAQEEAEMRLRALADRLALRSDAKELRQEIEAYGDARYEAGFTLARKMYR